jgi:hypothetical protein
MEVIIISNIESFNKYFGTFASESIICLLPRIYHVGIDTEYIVASKYPESYDAITNQKNETSVKICIMQICNGKTCLILKLSNFIFLPFKLISMLTSDLWIKTGVGINLDMTYIGKNFEIVNLWMYRYINDGIYEW